MNKKEKELIARFAGTPYGDLVTLPSAEEGDVRIEEASLFHGKYCIARKFMNCGTNSMVVTSVMRSVAGCPVSDKALNAAWEVLRAAPDRLHTIPFPGELPARGSMYLLAESITDSINLTMRSHVPTDVAGGIDAVGEVIESAKKLRSICGHIKAETILGWEESLDKMYSGRKTFLGEASGVADFMRRRHMSESTWPIVTLGATDELVSWATREASKMMSSLRKFAGSHTPYVLSTIMWCDNNSRVVVDPWLDAVTGYVISRETAAERRPYGGECCYGNTSEELFFMRADTGQDGIRIGFNRGGSLYGRETTEFADAVMSALASDATYRESVGYHIVEKRLSCGDIYVDGIPYNRDIAATTASLIKEGLPGKLYDNITSWTTDTILAIGELRRNVMERAGVSPHDNKYHE